MTPQRHLALDGAYNIRDLGGYPTTSGCSIRWRTFLRADSLHKLTPPAQQALIDYGVRTVIDLRFDDECSAAPNVFAASDQVTYRNISLLADAAPTAGRPMLPDLESIYKHILDARQLALKTVFAVMAADACPVLIHCTAGKDRTGVVAALLLGLAGVDHATIAADYALTTHYAAPLLAELRAEAAAAGRDLSTIDPYLIAPPAAMLNTLIYLAEKYGGVPAYLRHIGLTDAQIVALRQQLLDDRPAVVTK